MSERRYRFGPLEQRNLVGPLSASQATVLGAAALLGIGSIFLTQSVAGVFLALLLFGGAVLAIALPIQGRTLADWTPVLVRFGVRVRGAEYRTSSPSAGVHAGAEDHHELSLPPELEGLELLSAPYASDEVGVIYDRDGATYTAAIAVRAGAFALRDAAEQSRALEAWGGVLASCAREGSQLRRLQWIERTLPGQADQLAAYLQKHRDRSVPLDSTVVSSYIELIEAAAPVTQEHEVLICLQIDTRRASREMKRLGGGHGAACQLLLREADGLAQRLGMAEIRVLGLLRPRQYAEVIKDAFDPFGAQGRARSRLGDPEREGVDPALMGPHAEDVGWSYYRTDSAVHRAYWISSWPRSEVGPTFMAPLLMQSARVRAVSVTIEPVPFSEAMRKAELAQTSEIAGEMERRRQGFMTTASDRRQQQAVTRREDELADGFAEMRFIGTVSVAERSAEALWPACGDVEHACQLARLEVQPMYGEQDAGFANTLPLCRGLR